MFQHVDGAKTPQGQIDSDFNSGFQAPAQGTSAPPAPSVQKSSSFMEVHGLSGTDLLMFDVDDIVIESGHPCSVTKES